MSETFNTVWDALEDSREVGANLKARAALMREIRALVAEWDVSKQEAARRLGVTQPRLNDLLRGRIDRFSLDALVNLCAAGLT